MKRRIAPDAVRDRSRIAYSERRMNAERSQQKTRKKHDGLT